MSTSRNIKHKMQRKGLRRHSGPRQPRRPRRQGARQGVQEEERETEPTEKAEALRPLPDGTQG